MTAGHEGMTCCLLPPTLKQGHRDPFCDGLSFVHAGLQVGVRACALAQMCQRHSFLSFTLLHAHETAVQTTTQPGNCSPLPVLNAIPARHALLWSDGVPSFLVPSMSAAALVARLVPFGGWHHTNSVDSSAAPTTMRKAQTHNWGPNIARTKHMHMPRAVVSTVAMTMVWYHTAKDIPVTPSWVCGIK